MWNLIAPTVTPIINKLVDLIPNGNERKRAKEELEKELMHAVNAQALAQIEVNKTEAAHKNVFVAGWRPFIGWVCGLGLLWAFIGEPVAAWYITIQHPEITTLPKIESDGLYQLVLAMLGMGALRSWEKNNKVSREK